MRIGNRLFPYPLLNHERLYSQYKDRNFDLMFDGHISEDKNYVLENLRIDSNSDYLKQLVNEGKAELICVVECAQTMFRKKYKIGFDGKTVAISLKDLCGKASINAFAVATQPFKYKSDEFLDDYDEYDFDLEKNDIIAVDDGMITRIDFDDEEDTKKSSIFLIIKDATIKDETMNVEYDASKITISLPSSQWDLYDKNKKIKKLENLYFSIIAIPALTQCVSELQKPENSVDQLCIDYRWFSSFKKQFEEINETELTDEVFMKMNAMVESQKLLNTPSTKSIDDIFNMIIMKDDIGGIEE